MIIKSVELETVCGITSKLPENILPEIAFAGKSNVGKSSLINTIMNRKSFARISQSPGKTQTINFYNINNQIYYVDLPGYGYAKAPTSVTEKWGKMIEKYLRTSNVLKNVFLLIDIRHKPSENDKNMYEWILHNGFNPIIIATKVDKINRSQVQKHIKIIKEGLCVVPDTKIIPYSSSSKQGRDELWEMIEEIIKDSENIVDSESIADLESNSNSENVSGSKDEFSDEDEPVS